MMGYHQYFNFVCELVDRATQLFKDGKDRGFALGNILKSLCAADEKAHRLLVCYKALCRADTEEFRAVCKRKFDEGFEELAQERGKYFVLRPECNSMEQMRRLFVIQTVLLNREERIGDEASKEADADGETAYVFTLFDLYDVLDDYAEDIGAAIHGDSIEC